MKGPKLLFSSILVSLLGVGVFSGISLTKETVAEKAEAASSYSCSEMVIYDDIGWCFSTLYLKSFGYASGYSKTDFKQFVQTYYGTEKTSWDKQGTVRAWKSLNNDTEFNLCAGGATGKGKTFSFLLPSWVAYCDIYVENNSNSYNMGYLNNIRHYSNNTGDLLGSAVNKTVTFYAKDWGADSVLGSAKTTTDFNVSLTSIGKTSASNEIGRKTETVNKFEHVPDYSISGYAFIGWYSNSNLTTEFSGLVANNTTLYAKFATPKITIGSTEYLLEKNPDNPNEYFTNVPTLTSGQTINYYSGDTLVTTTAKVVSNNNYTSGKTVLVDATNAPVYVDISANTIWVGGLATGGFHMIINGHQFIQMSYGGEYDGYTQYMSSMIQFSVGDRIETINCGLESSLPVVFTIENINPEGLGSNFSVTNHQLKCTTAVSAKVYMKMRSDRNEIYFGDVDEYIAKAIKFADDFMDAIGGKCNPQGGSNVSQLTTAWGSQVTAFGLLSEESQGYLKDATGQEPGTIGEFIAMYYYVYGKYGYDNSWTDFLVKNPPRRSSTGLIISTSVKEGVSFIAPIIAVAVTGLAVGGYFLLRKKKED